MIKPSQRRRKPSDRTALQLHRQLARHRSRGVRLLAGSVSALLVSVTLWLLGMPLSLHLLATLAAFLLGFLYPARGALSWALRWIASVAGLSYQTALELDEDDAYGFREAVAARAALAADQVEPPQRPRWWLPIGALALGLALLPFTPFRDTNRFGNLALPGRPLSSGPATADTEAPSEVQEQAEQPEAPETTPETLAAAEAPPVLDEFDEASGEAPPDTLSENTADDEALSRFIENLSEREAPPEQSNPFGTVPPELSPQTDGERSEGDPNTQAASDRQQEGEQEAQQGGGGDSEGEQEGEQQAGSEDGSQGGQEETVSTEGQSQGEQQGEQTSQGGQDASATETQEPGSEAAAQTGLEEGGNDAPGQGQTTVNPQATTDLGEPEAGPEFLQGELGRGPNNLGGTIRLPGSAEETQAGPGRSGGFSSAEEQAITEGRIPLEYQDIVRNYFR